MDQMNCATRGCDRLATMASDSHGDLCGACRDAEFSLGREPEIDAFQRVMVARTEAWRAALTDADPTVRAFAEAHVFGEFGFSNRARSVYLAAGMGDRGIRAVYALLTNSDCPLLHAFDSRDLHVRLMPYFAAEFRAAPPWSIGWQHLARVTPIFLALGMRRMLTPKRGGFTKRTGPSMPSSARFD